MNLSVVGSFVLPLICARMVLPLRRTAAPRALVAGRDDRSVGIVNRLTSAPFQVLLTLTVALTIVRPRLGLTGVCAVLLTRWQWSGWRQRRRKRGLRQRIPGTLHDIARRMRSGYSAPLAFAEVLGATDAENSSIARPCREMLIRGEPLARAIRQWRDDMDRAVGGSVLDDLVVAVDVAEAVGGLRASALEVVADSASEGQALADETKAQASQARASATVMTIAPIVFCAQMVLRDRDASRLLLRTPVGWVLLVIGGLLDVLAWWWIHRLTALRSGQRRTAATTATSGRRWPAAERRSTWATAFAAELVFGRRTTRAGSRDLVRPSPVAVVREPPPSFVVRTGALMEAAIVQFAHLIGVRKGALDRVLGMPSTERTRRLGLVAVLLPPMLLVRPVLAVITLAVVVIGPTFHRSRLRRRTQMQRRVESAQAIELVRLALESGSTPSLAILVVAGLAGPALRPPLQLAADAIRHGVPIEDALRRLAHDAPELRSLSDVLVASTRLGLGVGETLRGLALEARGARRRTAEAHARRLPVILLFPVVCLTLPAFVVLTVLPLLLTGLGSLRF